MARRWMLVSLCFVACSGASMAQERGAAPPRPEPADREDARPARTEAIIDPSTIDRDITLAVHGNIIVDHIGPDAVEAALARFASAPTAYLERFEARFFVRDGATMQPVPAQVRAQILLGHLYPHAPERVRRMADRLLRIDGAALRDGRQTDPHGDIAARDRALALLAAGVDVAFDESWSAVRPDDWCRSSAPVVGAVIRVERTCTCGEPLACAARLREGALEVVVRVDENAPGPCLDCYPTHAACRLPTLPGEANIPVVIEGEARGALTTAFNGVVINGPRCR